jgi:preprotein translocase subunit SecA
MTGTAMTEAEEFHKIYQLEVVAIPTHQPMVREDETDLVYLNETAKFNALIDEIEELQEEGRPVLVGTVSVEKSERLSDMLKRRGVKHEVLNAKFHEKESGIVAQAGKSGAVTIATNMAGRGTDILLGGNPAGLASDLLHKRGLNPAEVDKDTYAAALAEAKAITDEDHERVVQAGGLHIIGTERHESRRIDNQLRGRAGRQGDPGSSRFYLSLDDDLMKRFASERVTAMMERLGLDEDNYIESGIVGKTIESAQTRVEGFNFDIRKRVVEFDDVINRQRETIYAERDKVLRNEDLTETIRVFLDADLEDLVERHVGAEGATAETIADLVVELNRMGMGAEHVKAEELLALRSVSDIAQHLRDTADEMLEAREKQVGPETWATIERFVLLRTIDSLWVEHLTEVDDMRRGIGLRGYAQQDPLNEFRKEAFRLYEELSGFIQHQVASTIFRVQLQQQPHVHTPEGVFPMPGPGQQAAAALAAGVGSGGRNGGAAPRQGVRATAGPGVSGTAGVASVARGAMGAGLAAGGGAAGAGQQARPGYTPSGAKIGRNDACWCGSGLKYKKCHGR